VGEGVGGATGRQEQLEALARKLEEEHDAGRKELEKRKVKWQREMDALRDLMKSVHDELKVAQAKLARKERQKGEMKQQQAERQQEMSGLAQRLAVLERHLAEATMALTLQDEQQQEESKQQRAGWQQEKGALVQRIEKMEAEQRGIMATVQQEGREKEELETKYGQLC